MYCECECEICDCTIRCVCNPRSCRICEMCEHLRKGAVVRRGPGYIGEQQGPNPLVTSNLEEWNSFLARSCSVQASTSRSVKIKLENEASEDLFTMSKSSSKEPKQSSQSTVQPKRSPQSTVEPKQSPQSTLEPKQSLQSIVEPKQSPQYTVEPKQSSQTSRSTVQVSSTANYKTVSITKCVNPDGSIKITFPKEYVCWSSPAALESIQSSSLATLAASNEDSTKFKTTSDNSSSMEPQLSEFKDLSLTQSAGSDLSTEVIPEDEHSVQIPVPFIGDPSGVIALNNPQSPCEKPLCKKSDSMEHLSIVSSSPENISLHSSSPEIISLHSSSPEIISLHSSSPEHLSADSSYRLSANSSPEHLSADSYPEQSSKNSSPEHLS